MLFLWLLSLTLKSFFGLFPKEDKLIALEALDTMGILEKAFISKHGFNCSVYKTRLGHRNGYIEISLGNKAHINSLDEKLDSMEVHGGITYNNEHGDIIILGFDCAHAGDLMKCPEKYKGTGMENMFMYSDGVWRDEQYCTDECESMAKQLMAMLPKQLEG